MLLMNRGFVLGTGDLSEQALGWSTYNGDHMSMYNVNASIPKTLVKFLVRYVAEREFTGEIQACLLDIVQTPISPSCYHRIAADRLSSSPKAASAPTNCMIFSFTTLCVLE